MLHTEVTGAGPRVALVHGFTQTLDSMQPLAERLEPSYTVIRVDLPGHGGSAEPRGGVPEAAADLAAACGQASYVGYSMGARICLRLALDQPGLVTALVLLSGTPGIEAQAVRQERRAEDERLARDIERSGVADFIDRWLGGPLFASLPEELARRAERLGNFPSGLAAALRGLGTGAQQPLWDRLAALPMPVLLVAGERDQKFVDIAHRCASAIGPSARVALVPDAGHAVHLERPPEVAELIVGFLRTIQPGARA